MAHGDADAQQTFERHLPFWRAHALPILVMCPRDSVVKTGLQTLLIGKRCHHGAEANIRFRTLLETLAKTEYDRHVIFEYDSLCLVPELPYVKHDAVGAIWFVDSREVKSCPLGNKPFIGSCYSHPPLIMSTHVMNQVIESMWGLPEDCEYGMWDRYLGLACQRGEIKRTPLGSAFSMNTIRNGDAPNACAAARNGTVIFHGVKSAKVLEQIMDAHRTHASEIAT